MFPLELKMVRLRTRWQTIWFWSRWDRLRKVSLMALLEAKMVASF